jgi:hypothetical protein
VLGPDEYLVVDSSALAQGTIGRGTFRLNPQQDSVVLRDSWPHSWPEVVAYPRYPTSASEAPTPPGHGSISRWNFYDDEVQSLNWYCDSTPTRGAQNDDYSAIAGTVTGTGGVLLDEAYVLAHGMFGYDCLDGVFSQQGFVICGLGAGEYQLCVEASYQGRLYYATYPDSVVAAYGDTLSGVAIVVPVDGIGETPSQTQFLIPLLAAAGRLLRVIIDGSSPVEVQVYDQVGVRVLAHRFSPTVGERRIELPAALPPGVYFAVAQQGVHRSTVKVVLW